MTEKIAKKLIKILSIIAYLFRRNIDSPVSFEVRSIAVFQMSGVGDLLLITPALRALHHIYPNAEFDIITYTLKHAEFLFRLPYVRKGYEFPLFDLELKYFWTPTFWRKMIKPIRFLRKNKYDIYISFHHTWLPQWYLLELLLAASSGASFRVGINPDTVKNPGVFDRSINESALGFRHYRLFFGDVVRLLGDPGEDHSIEFPLTTTEIESAAEQIRSEINSYEKLVCLHVGASHDSKRWPIRYFLELAKRLASIGCGIILVGTKKEQSLTHMIKTNLPMESCLDTAGKTNLFEMGALINASDLFIGNDSGPLHVAIARSRPTIGLIGPYIPRFHQYSDQEATIIRNPVADSEYDAISIKDALYTWKISVDQVFEEAIKIIQ